METLEKDLTIELSKKVSIAIHNAITKKQIKGE
jgi:hypothetical protein